MSNQQTDKETERFYNLSYFVIPIPMIAGLAFAAYVLITEDSRNISFCTIAKQETAYTASPLQETDFISFEKKTLNLCKDDDDTIDNDDGRTSGKVRWFVCKGTSCGPGWQKLLSQKQ